MTGHFSIQKMKTELSVISIASAQRGLLFAFRTESTMASKELELEKYNMICIA